MLLYGARWLRDRALPAGYGIAAAGCVLFLVGGAPDLAWHTAFGIERGIAALLSPTHMLLILSGGLISTGPLLAAWRRPEEKRAPLTAILAATLLLTGFTFATQFDHPWVQQWAQPDWIMSPISTAYQLGFLGVVLQTAFLMGVLLTLRRRFELPFGTVTVVTGINAVFVTFIHQLDPVILVAVLGGLGGDLLLLLLRDRIQVWAAAFPMVLYTLYFLGLARVDGIWWEVHVVAASVVAAGIVGWLLSRVLYTAYPGPRRDLAETS